MTFLTKHLGPGLGDAAQDNCIFLVELQLLRLKPDQRPRQDLSPPSAQEALASYSLMYNTSPM